ncbi:MAG: hypothetical protein ACR2PI_22405 [Hyphomicrobiaceae bacterium]
MTNEELREHLVVVMEAMNKLVPALEARLARVDELGAKVDALVAASRELKRSVDGLETARLARELSPGSGQEAAPADPYR